MNRLIAYLGILASIILGGILGLIASVLVLGILGVTISNVHVQIGIALGAFIGGVLSVIRVRRYLRKQEDKKLSKHLASVPENVVELIKSIIMQMRYRKKVRDDVMAELATHFEDELQDYSTDEEKQTRAEQLIADFGDAKLLAVLMRRAKKRCRPLWRTIIVRTFQTTSVLILCLIVYVVWFLTGKPVISTNYVTELNRIVRPVTDDNLNAAPLYEKAIALFDDPNNYYSNLFRKDYNEVQPEEKQQIEQWIADNKAIFDLVKAGTNKPYHWQQYQGDEMMSIIMPNLREFKRFAYAWRWRAQLHAEKGRYEDAFDDIKSCYRMGQHLRGDKTLIEQLVGMAIEAKSVQTIRDILSKYKVDSSLLAVLQSDFERIIADEDFTVSLKAEKLFMYDEIQRCFTEDRLGEGHLYINRLMALGQDNLQITFKEVILEGVLSAEGLIAAPKVLFTHPNKQQTKETADRIYAFWEGLAHKTPARTRAENIDIEKEIEKLIKGNLLLEVLTPFLTKLLEISYRNKVDVEATITTIGILRYNTDTGYYPGSLEELLTLGYVKNLPIDPFSDRPLVYRKIDDGFTLYSVGLNFIDDGGRFGKDKKGRPRLWVDDGDVVFWPVQN